MRATGMPAKAAVTASVFCVACDPLDTSKVFSPNAHVRMHVLKGLACHAGTQAAASLHRPARARRSRRLRATLAAAPVLFAHARSMQCVETLSSPCTYRVIMGGMTGSAFLRAPPRDAAKSAFAAPSTEPPVYLITWAAVGSPMPRSKFLENCETRRAHNEQRFQSAEA